MAKVHRWSTSQRVKHAATIRRKRAAREQAAPTPTPPLESHVVEETVGERAEREVRRFAGEIERRGFRRGMIHVVQLILEDIEPEVDN